MVLREVREGIIGVDRMSGVSEGSGLCDNESYRSGENE